MNKINDIHLQIDSFIKHISRNKSKLTVKNYESDLYKFSTYLEENFKVADFRKMEQDLFLDYIEHLTGKFAPATVHRRLYSLYSFLQYLHRGGHVKKLPFYDAKELKSYLPIKQKKRVKALTQAQVKNMLFSCENLFEECLIRTFYDTAARVSEICNLKWDDIDNDFGKYSVRVLGKGSQGMTKERFARLSESTYCKLMELREEREFESEYVFASEKHHSNYTDRSISSMIKKIADRCHLEDVTTHTFRKTMATNLLNKGLDISFISQYLGHSSLATTQHYLDVERDLHDKIGQFADEL